MTQTKTIADAGSTPAGSTILNKELSMFKFLKSLFGLTRQPLPPPVRVLNQDTTLKHDIIDYDGMGNQGRFPVEKTKNKAKK